MTSPRILLKAWNIYPKKKFGQIFLSDPATAKMIVHCSGISSENVVFEIGAGLGALTIPLASIAHKVYAIEKDSKVISLLKNELVLKNIENVILLDRDILDIDIEELAAKEGGKILIIGNLPYNISSQILVKLMHSRDSIDRAVLMFQKELATRLTADPGNKDYGRISVMLQYCADIRTLARVKAVLFYPAPKVDSEVLEIAFKKNPEYPASDEHLLFNVIKAAFGKRRKTLKNALSASELNIDAKTAENALWKSDINPSRRAETLSIAEFVSLSNSLGDILKQKSETHSSI